MSERPHVLPSAAFWFRASRAEQRKGNNAESIMAMEQAYNHVEGALVQAVRYMRKTAPIGFMGDMTGEKWNKFLEQFKHVSD